VLGPGPGRPEAATLSLAAVRAFGAAVPTLGVCLGFQVMGLAFGATIAPAREPVHGRTTRVHHDGCGLFRGLPSPLQFTRYNSLAVRADDLPACLAAGAHGDDGDLMALRHREWPLEGVQFHPSRSSASAGWSSGELPGRLTRRGPTGALQLGHGPAGSRRASPEAKRAREEAVVDRLRPAPPGLGHERAPRRRGRSGSASPSARR
jgi:GMP synthase-like glutamine amidotransferase